MRLFLGIEAIAMRSTIAVASDSAGRIISARRLRAGGVTLHTTDRDLLRIRLLNIISSVAQEAGLRLNDLSDATICLGLTGVTFPYDAFELQREFERLEIPVRNLICTGDAEIIFASHTQAEIGTALVCHMGSTAYIASPAAPARYGGWGPVIGDEGSGYWIGKAALRAIGEEYDKRADSSILWEEISNWLSNPEDSQEWTQGALLWRRRLTEYIQRGDDPRTAIFGFVHELSNLGQWPCRAIMSGLAIPLMRAWKLGDEVAKNIATRAVDHLVRQYVRACEVARVRPDCGPFVLYGGLFLHHSPFRELILKRLALKFHREFQAITAHSPNAMRPACGALMFALGESHTRNLRLPSRSVIECVLDDQRKYAFSGELAND